MSDGSLLARLRKSIGRSPSNSDGEPDADWPARTGDDRLVAVDGNAGARGPLTMTEIGGVGGTEFDCRLGVSPDDDGVAITLSATNRAEPTADDRVHIGGLGVFAPGDAREIAAVIEACADYHDAEVSD